MKNPSTRLRLALSASAIALASIVLPTAAEAATCNWLVAAGNWATGGNWSCGVQPSAVDATVITGPGAVVTATGINASTGTLNLGAGNQLILENSFLTVFKTAVTNNGTMSFVAGSEFRSGSGSINIGGTGKITLINTDLGGGTAATWTFGSGQTLNGAGLVGLDNAVMINNGLISSDLGGTIGIDPRGQSGGVALGTGVGSFGIAGLLNNGTIQGTNGSSLSLRNGLYENSATGIIRATDDSRVMLNNEVRIIGGVLTSDATSTIEAVGPPSSNFYLTDLTLTTGSRLNINGGNLNLDTAFTNNGTIRAVGDSSLVTGVHGTAGTIRTDAGATLSIGAASTMGTLINDGTLALGANAVTVTSDYSNANFGSGNAFNARANVTGAGPINAASATMDLSAPGLVGNTLNVGNVRVGGSTNLTITNNGVSTFERGAAQNLGAPSVTLTGADWTAAAGGGTAVVGINFATAGSLAGQTLNVVNNFDNVGDRILNLQGGAYQIANPVISNAASFLSIGPVLVGTVVTRTLDIVNSQVVGAVNFQEGLNVSWGALTGNSIAGTAGSITNLHADNNDGSSMVLTFDTSTAGAKVGAIGVLLASNGAGTSGLGLLGLPTQNLSVTGMVTTGVLVLNPAVANILTAQPITVAAQRVGGSNTASITVRNDGIGPAAGLDGSFNSATGSVSGSGSFINIGSGSSSSAIQVGVNTAVSGVRTGTATLDFSSNLSPNPNVALPSQTVNVTGNVYAAAVANVSSSTVNFGTVRQGAASPMGSLTVTNGASGALTDGLVTSTSGLPSGVSATAPGPLAAGASGSAKFSLDTATAGNVSGSGALTFASHNSEMADLALASQSVTFVGTITELSKATLFKSSGAGVFTGGGTSYTLDFGSLTSGSGVFNSVLGVLNDNSGLSFAELLGGSFTQGAGAGYAFTGNSFAGLIGGTSNIGDLLSFDTTGLANGTYTKTITFNGFSSYTGLGDLSLSPITFNVTALVSGGSLGAVPEPSTWLMMILGFGFIGSALRRRRATVSAKIQA